jgi:hypothetical protein
MNNIKRILTGLNIEPIKQKLNAHPEWWDEITIRQDHPGSYHKDTEAIYLVGPVSFSYEDVYTNLGLMHYPHWADFDEELESLSTSIIQAAHLTRGGRVMLVKLKPGGVIDYHVDEGPYAEQFSRFHIPIITNPKCMISVDQDEQRSETEYMKAGEMWWFNHRKPHFVFNHGTEDRIHLIIDAVSEKYPVMS